MPKNFFSILFCCALFSAKSQNIDSLMINKIYHNALSSNSSYENLIYLCQKIGPRLCGSHQAAAAVEWSKQTMEKMKLDTVFLQEVKVPHWERGAQEEAFMVSSILGKKNLNVCALGKSVGTTKDGILSEVLEVHSFEELSIIGEKGISGRFVFFNVKMNPAYINPFQAYGEVASFRYTAASKAAKYKAVAVIIHSMSLTINDFPHTGLMKYNDSIEKIPAIAISTKDAEVLSEWLKKDPSLKLFVKTNCRSFPDTISHNVIGEIKGSDFPDEYIIVGGHLDSWDITEGAHDDGAGCVQAIDVLRIFKELGYKPRHSIRAVMFMDEEFGQTGGKEYALQAKINNEKYIAAIESDGGGTTPIGFSTTGNDSIVAKLSAWSDMFKPYGLYLFYKGWGGVDIGPLGAQGVPLIGLNVDPHRYFEYHHSANDTVDKVNNRELQLGSAALAALIYLIDKKDNF